MNVLLVALGGAAGSVARYLAGSALQRPVAGFPWGTLFVNVAGCLAAGAIVRLVGGSSSEPGLRAALVVGFCGGFTTFSAFSLEAVALMQEGRLGAAIAYVVITVVAGLAGTSIALVGIARA